MGVVQVLPYPAAVAPPMGDMSAALVGFETPTANGTTSIIHPDLTGLIPRCGLFVGARASSTSSYGGQCGFTIGAVQRTGRFSGFDSVGFCSGSQGNLASTNVQRFQGSAAYYTVDYGISISNLAYPTLVEGGASVGWSSTASFTYRGSVLFLEGDIDAVASYRDLGSLADVRTATIGMPVDALITFGNGSKTTTGRTSVHSMIAGFATPDGTQRCLAQAEADNVGSGSPFSAMFNDCCFSEINANNGSVFYKVNALNWGASGFSLQSSLNAGDDSVGYLALNLNGRRCKIVDFVSPTAPGTMMVSGTGFTPQAAIILGSSLEAMNQPAAPTSELMSNFMMSTVTASAAWAHVTSIQSGADPTKAWSWSTEKAVALLNPVTGAPLVSATLGEFNPDGMSLVFDTVAATGKRFFALLIE